jgi:hypothetical protein
MSETRFEFICYGVPVHIRADSVELKADLAEEIVSTIPGVEERVSEEPVTTFEISRAPDGSLTAFKDGQSFLSNLPRENFYHVFSTFLRMAIAENSPDLLFIHAGAVAWNGQGIILPGDSMVGKSTLVAELVRLGAEYYSDDYAVFDSDGLLHPFPREISMRSDDGRYRLNAADLGTVGNSPLQPRVVWMTRYEEGARWEPRILTQGQGVLEMLPYTFAFVDRPNFSLPILNKLAANAIIVSGKRGSANVFAKTLLEFVDNVND